MQTGSQHPFGEAGTTEYMVKKQTVARRQCTTCHGTGTAPRGGRCLDCKEGISTVIHTTEVDLITALVELGLIKKPNTQV
jgi:DnaJ-class molecular chaperone